MRTDSAEADYPEPVSARLYGSMPWALIGRTFTRWQWLVGLLILVGGVPLQLAALSLPPLSEAMPIFVAAWWWWCCW